MKVKLNGTIHADAQGTYMMCGQKRVPVKLVDANGNEVKPETVKEQNDDKRISKSNQNREQVINGHFRAVGGGENVHGAGVCN